jgi:hypothetical protein
MDQNAGSLQAGATHFREPPTQLPPMRDAIIFGVRPECHHRTSRNALPRVILYPSNRGVIFEQSRRGVSEHVGEHVLRKFLPSVNAQAFTNDVGMLRR